MRLTALAGLAAFALLGVPAAAAAPALVDPGQEERGAGPRVAWYDRQQDVVHAGDHRIGLPRRGGTVWRLRGAAGGFVIERSGGGEDILTMLRTSGKTQRLAREVLSWEVATGGGAGRRVAVLRGSPDGVVVDVVRVSDGRLVARRPAGGLWDFHEGTVWFERRGGELAAWDVATGHIADMGVSVWALDAGRGAMAYRRGGCTWVGPVGEDADWKPWCSKEAGVFSWSPDGRWVLTHTLPSGDEDGITRKIVVRNARTGRQVRAFSGYFGDGYPDPRWEGSTAFLVTASDPAGQPTGEAAVMRLKLDGTVVRASVLHGDWPWETRALYASAR